jgi:cytochrome c biogenesis protein CcdA/glutaredoxin
LGNLEHPKRILAWSMFWISSLEPDACMRLLASCRHNLKCSLPRAVLPLLLLTWAVVSHGQAEPERVHIYFFSSATCPHCQAQAPFLEGLSQRHEAVVLEVFELGSSRRHHELFARMAHSHGLDGSSVPTVMVGGRGWVGDSQLIRDQIEQQVFLCLARACPDSRQLAELGAVAIAPESNEGLQINLPWVGQIDLRVQPLTLSTALIAFIDGFNPCSLWVLTILLALVIHSGSRRRVMVVGLTYLSVTAAIYGLFIAGVFGVLSYLIYVTWIYWLVALLALIFAVVNIKDYFWYKRGLSFTIDDRHKPGIYRRIRGLISDGHSWTGLVLATAVMAAGIALIELPCTAGFPVIWTSLLAGHDIDWWRFSFLLGLYLLIYLGIELVVFITALVTFRVDRFEERHGRMLKLIGGLIMLALALVLLLAPELMQHVGASLGVFVGATLVAMLIILLHRVILPRFGIVIGDRDTSPDRSARCDTK